VDASLSTCAVWGASARAKLTEETTCPLAALRLGSSFKAAWVAVSALLWAGAWAAQSLRGRAQDLRPLWPLTQERADSLTAIMQPRAELKTRWWIWAFKMKLNQFNSKAR
jgi:hypothetical protein